VCMWEPQSGGKHMLSSYTSIMDPVVFK